MKYTFDSLYYNETDIIELWLGSERVWKKNADSEYDETKIALIVLDENGQPTDQITYFDNTSRGVLRYYMQEHSDDTYMLRIGRKCTVSKIETNACYNSSNLLKVNILNSLKGIGSGAFQSCQNLEEINLPESLIYSGPRPLNRTKISRLTIPGSLKTIPAGFASECPSLTDLIIEHGVETIDATGAFQYCTSLTNVELPDSMTHIRTDAFRACTGLREIFIPNSVTYMYDPFALCSSELLVYIDNTCVDTKDGNGGWARSYWGLNNFNQMVWIRGMNVFSLGTGNTRSSAGTQYSFSSFSDLANWLRNNTASSYWVDIGDTVGPITPAGPLPTLVYARFVGRNMTIYGGVFSGYAPNLVVLDTGDYMEQINDSFCNGCSSLSNVRIGTAVKSIGRSAFANCAALTSIAIPSNVETIDSEAFSNSSNLTTITINKSEGSITGAPWGATNATVVWTG